MKLRSVMLFLSGFAPSLGFAQSELGTIRAGDGRAENQFGYSLSMNERHLLVGAVRGDRDGFDDSGSVYVFDRDGRQWKQSAKLVAKDAQRGARFGVSVALDGDVALIGASRAGEADGDGGAVYFFERKGVSWTQRAKLVPADLVGRDMFGFSVAMKRGVAVVGAYRNQAGGSEAGSAYVFMSRGGSWTQVAKLSAHDAARENWLGRSVATDGERVLAGATGDNHGGDDSGAAYVFVLARDGWRQEAKLVANDAGANDRFGRSVAMAGDYAFVGAFWDDDRGEDAGAVYVFHRDETGWKPVDKLTAINGGGRDYFGVSMAAYEDWLVVGALLQDDAGEDAGAGYFFHRVGGRWTQPFRVTARKAAAHDWFGFAVAIHGNFAAIGAVRDDDGGFDAGSVELFSLKSGAVDR